MSIRNNLVLALTTVKKNRARTLMSMAGVAIGVLAVIVVTVASQSGKAYVFEEFKSYGLSTLWIYRDYQEDNPELAKRSGTGIDNDLYARIKRDCCPHVKRFSSQVYPEDWNVTVKYNNDYTKSSVEGVDVSYVDINNDRIIAGRNLREEDMRKRRPVGLIAPQAIKELFGSESVNPVGKSVELSGLNIQIVGVLRRKDRSLLESLGLTLANYDVNSRILIPYTLYQQSLGSRDIQQLMAEASSLKDAPLAISEIMQFLKRYHNERYQFKAESMQEWVDTANQIISIITLTGTISAIAALLVGGVGIYNIMSFSVSERTREIGLRRAVGATMLDIRLQFLMESGMIGLAGGILGVMFALGLSVYIIFWGGVSLGLSWLVFIVAPLFAVITGIVAGYKPAVHAAGLSPMEALRFEN